MTLPLGNDAAHAAFAGAMASGHMHHAWLFTGPEGIGKASFARMAAIRLLAEAAAPGTLPPGFEVPEGNRTRALIEAGSHPDYRELARLPRDADKPEGELARSITIAQVRSLLPMFATKPSMSAKRVILIDAVDDLERPGASNALLKNLEEPPEGTIFLLISHAPGRLLPTIRSRCRRLRFDPLDEAQMRTVLGARLPQAPAAEIDAMIAAAGGSPGRALGYAGLGMAELDGAMTSIAGSGDAGNRLRAALAKSLGSKAAQARYEAFLDRAPSFIATQAETRRGPGLREALDAYDAARALAASARTLSLDQQATVYEMAGIVARLAGDVTSPATSRK
jgi:DNA polymerase-3 subunit delta'